MTASILLLEGILLIALSAFAWRTRRSFWELFDELREVRSTLREVRSTLIDVKSAVNHLTAVVRQIPPQIEGKTLEIQNAVALASLNLRFPIFTGNWSIDTFMARFLIRHLLEARPRTIVELGSGTSTVIVGKVLQLLGESDVAHVAVDHEGKYLELTKRLATLNGVGDKTEFWECPLIRYEVFDKLWYGGLADKLSGRKIDLLLVDGPPGPLQPQSRYPALPVLAPFLAQHCTVVLDDAIRQEEQEIANRWVREIPGFKLEISLHGHGMAVLSR